MSVNNPFKLVIAGGGIAGLGLATRLGNKLGHSRELNITLIDKGFSHVWKPMLHRFAAGTAKNENDRIPFLSHAANHNFHFCFGEISGIDRENRRIKLDSLIEEATDEVVLNERFVEYDAVVFTLGSRANDFNTPGVKEHCIFLDNVIEADSFNKKFRHALLQAYGQNKSLDIAIVGGGATGVQLAAELRKALDIGSLYNFTSKMPEMRLTLFESSPSILAAFPKEVSEAATEQLKALNITVRTGVVVSGADETGFILKDGSRVDAQFRVWAAGVKAPEVTSKFDGLECTRNGQLVVKPNLQTEKDERIFALGDCSFIHDAALPPTAQVARQEGIHLAKHLPEWMLNKKPVPDFKYKNRGSVVELGSYNGWGVLPDGKSFGGGSLHGLIARWGHAALYHQHQIEMYGLRRGLIAGFNTWLDGFVSPSVKM